MRHALILVALLLGLAPARADVRITASNGGNVLSYLQFFSVLDQSGERVILDGPCLSACTLVLSAIPPERICVTSRAILGFHAARLLDVHSDPDHNRSVFISAGMCLVLCAVFFAADFGCKHLGEKELLSPALAAWLPVLVFGPLSFAMFDAIHT